MKKVLITGANSGFGYHMTLEFARNGYHVYATTRSLDKDGVTRLNAIAKEEGLNVEWLVLDVTKDSEIKAAYETVKTDGGLDVLINNAGYGVIGPIECYDTDEVKKQFETNVFGVTRMIYTFLPLLEKSSKAAIINISSIAGLIAAPAYGLYSGSKWALEAFTEVLRYELHKTSIRVSLIEPGGFNTRFSNNATGLGMPGGNKRVSWFEALKEKRGEVIGSMFTKLRDPRHVSKLALKLAEQNNPKLRNVIGFDAKVFYFLRRLMPARLWEMVVKNLVK